MPHARSSTRVVSTCLLLATPLCLLAATGVRADCPALTKQLDAALAAHSVTAAKAAEKGIYLDDQCSGEDGGAKQRIVAMEIGRLDDPALPDGERDAILADLRNPAGWLHDWQGAASAGDALFAQRRFTDAIGLYDRAIALAGDPSAMSDAEKRDVLSRDSAAKMLASDDGKGDEDGRDGGRRQVAFAATTRGPDGALGGIYAPSMRGVVPVAVPLPINFLFDSTEFSPVGAKAAAELGDYLKQQGVAAVTLIGHTDRRGADDYNVRLSEARVRRLADYLSKRGVTARITAIGKGWHDPLDTSHLPFKPDQEETWALNRRVELLR